MEKWLKDIFPILDIEHDCILSKQGDITIVYKVNLPEIFTLSNSEYEAFHQAWVKAIKVLPNNTTLCKQDWFTEAGFKANFERSDSSFLFRSSELFFNERPYLDHHCYIMLTRKADGRKPSSSLFSTLIRPHFTPAQSRSKNALQEFLDCCGQFKQILEDSGLASLTRLKEQDIFSSKKTTGLLERYTFLNLSQEQKVIRDIELKPVLKVGGNYCQLYTISEPDNLPPLCGSRINYEKYSTDRTKFSVGFASSLGQLLPCNHIYSQYIIIEEPVRTIKQLETKRLRLQSLSAYSRANTIARDATNDFLNEAISEGRLPVKAHFNLMVWSEDPEKLKDLKNMVSSAFSQMDAVAKEETQGAAQIFWAGIPGNAADFPLNESFDTFVTQATCFLNLETGYKDSISPMGIRLGDRLTGKPIHVDISDEPILKGICTNRNKFIIGPSGSGKSFFTNHLVNSYYEQGTHIVLIDVGHSYKGLCDMVDGYYFTYSETQPIAFNPFYIGPGDFLDTEKKESIKTLLLALWKKDDEVYKRSEYVALSNAISGYFAHLETNNDIFPGFNSFYEYLQSDYINQLQKEKVKISDFDIDNFLYVLRPYYANGEFDYLLNASKNLDLLNQRFIVFELDNIKDHPILFPTVTLIIMEVFISKMRKLKGIRKMILIEEAWKALMKEGFSQYIQYLFKTVRKHFGEAIVVTQEIQDIISSPIVKQAILNNSDCKILLDQSKYQNKFDQIQELLGLTEKEKTLVLSVNKSNDPGRKYKEVFISLGGQLSKVYRTEVSLEEYLAYTTEQSEKVKVEQYAARYNGDIRKGIAALAKEIKEST